MGAHFGGYLVKGEFSLLGPDVWGPGRQLGSEEGKAGGLDPGSEGRAGEPPPPHGVPTLRQNRSEGSARPGREMKVRILSERKSLTEHRPHGGEEQLR